jgi:hypothetical protein
MIYDSRLDGELNQVAQERVQFAQGGPGTTSASTPASTEALRAGKVAAQRQARFLQEELNGG